jgi:hypothetical protein
VAAATLIVLSLGVASSFAQQAPSDATMAQSIDDFVVGNRILADQGVITDGFGHLSFRSPADPGRFFMARARRRDGHRRRHHGVRPQRPAA